MPVTAIGRARVLLFAVVLSTIGCDRVTKDLAESHLKGTAPRTYLMETVRLQYVENRGAFLSLGADWSAGARFWILTVGSALLLTGVLVSSLRRPPSDRIVQLGLALLVGGGLGNLADRALRSGSVVDFVVVGAGPLRTGVFNVADLALTTSVILLVLTGLRRRSAPGRNQ
jgi:signal peptidase II